MKRASRLAGVALVALCIGGIFASGADAAAKALHLTYGGNKLSAGQEVEAHGTTWELQSTGGNVVCSHSEKNEGFLGKDETNDAKTDSISVETVFGAFEESAGCNITIPGFQSSRALWFNANTNSNEVKGKFKLSDSLKAEYVTDASQDTVIALESPESSYFCFWEVKKLKGATGSFPGEAKASFTSQKLKLLKTATEFDVKSDPRCPKKVSLTTSFGFVAQLGKGNEGVIDGSVS